MLTWLDYYVAGARDTLAAAGVPAHRLAGLDDRAAMVELCRASLLALARQGGVSAAALGGGPLLAACVLPFCATAAPDRLAWSEGWADPRGLQPDRALIADLAHAPAPAANRAEAVATLRAQTWYLDLPHGALLLDDARQVRAIFALAGPATASEAVGDLAAPSGVTIVAIVTRIGRDEMEARVSWGLTADGALASIAPLVEATPPFDDAEVRQRVTDFLLLLMLYRLTARPDETSELPRRPSGHHPATKPHKARAERRRWTLFRVVRLSSPPDRFGRPPAAVSEGGGWRLDHRVRVRGHFRLQPYGPGHQWRRLQWIAAHHRGPEDAPMHVDLEKRPHRPRR